MKRKYLILIIIIIVFVIIYSFGVFLVNNENSKATNILKSILPTSVKNILKTKIYEKQEMKKTNSKLHYKINEFDNLYNFKIESLEYLKNEYDIENFDRIYFKKYKNINISTKKNTFKIKIFHTPFLNNPIHQEARGSGFIEETKNNIIIVDSIGSIYYVNKSDIIFDKFFAKNIPSNLSELIKYEDFYNKYEYSIKDILIFQNKIYLSFTNEISKECFNTSIIVSDFNLDFLKFTKFFSPKACVKKNNKTGFFNPHIAGGRIVSFDQDHLLLSTGDFQNYELAQNINNIFGKILKINILNNKFEIVSLGHRNIQGLKYDKEDGYIISTEHGPIGGDEINLNKLNKKEILNFGWPQASYGDHYTTKKEKRYDLAPLHKNHEKYGYVEPLIYYTPSIAISEIENVENFFAKNDLYKDYFVGSLGKDIDNGQLSIHHLKLDYEKEKLIKYDIIQINERIRDLKYSKQLNLILLFLENSASIGILERVN